uniref:PIH1 domain-containing protein 1 n=1 Tax=Amblyomma aureolatum TaxID=187763 RepID=A0A1E1X8V3_9ACAR
MSERNYLEVPEESDAPYESLFRQANEEFKNLVQSLSDGSKPDIKTKPIKPKPGFCVKLKDTATGAKIFVNVCHTPELPEPRDIDDEELIHILESEDPTSYRVPLSLGLPHEEVDKNGSRCTAYDVIINETFFRKVSSNELFKTFLITVALDGIEDKYGVNPDRENYVVLKNRPYMGTMPEHCIQDRKGPLIWELPTSKSESAASNSSGGGGDDGTASDGGFGGRNPVAWRGSAKLDLTRHSLPGQRDTLVARFSLPGVDSGASLVLDMGEDHVQLISEEPKYSFDFYLPFLIDEDSAVAEFNTKHQVLTITVPLQSHES